MKEFLKKQAEKIDKELGKFFPRKISRKWLKKYFGKPEFVFDEFTLSGAVSVPVWDFLDRGGKRWRPALMLLCCEAVGGKEKNALPFSVIPELVHSGTILSDDVEDNAEFRRGKPALHKIYGFDLAVNLGSLLYFLPFVKLLNKPGISEKQQLELYRVYVLEMLKLSFGQGMDIFWHQGKKERVSGKEYLQMCVFKTGTLARLAAEFGAIIGGGSKGQ
ncbi:MAG: polyprenyl synthetase family protein, partial [Candidatus Diapherotrites archaeon]|nr:polyprenyl synthetase family protein [Candidatus Diapherotrites archaeon]